MYYKDIITDLVPSFWGLFNNLHLLDNSRFLMKTISSQIVDNREGSRSACSAAMLPLSSLISLKLDLVKRLTSSKSKINKHLKHNKLK